MRALVVLVLMVLAAAASALAYTTGGVAAEVGAIAATWKEPATLIVSGSLLIGAASVVRRFTF